MTFFGQLCNAAPELRVKEVFVYRLIHYVNSPSSVTGFFPDLHRILGKYKLEHYMYSFINSGLFPSKLAWRTIVNRSIKDHETFNTQCSIVTDESLLGFEKVYQATKPCFIWELSKEYREHTNRCITVMKLCSKLFGFRYEQICLECGMKTDTIAIHLIMYGRNNCSVRFKLWNTLYVYLGLCSYEMFISLSPREQCIEMVAGLPSFTLSDDTRKQCVLKLIVRLHKLGRTLRLPYKQFHAC